MRTNLVKKKDVPTGTSHPESNALDMVIAFDTTGSMSSYIDSVKEHVKELIPKLLSANPNMRIGVVAFGDYCDMVSKDKFGTAYQALDLTDDREELINFVTNTENTSGGDGDEFYELVIKKITEETSWRDGSTRAVLLIADSCPHKVGYSYRSIVKNSKIDWKEEAKKAIEKGIKFDTSMICHREWMKELSSMTNGVSVPFSSSNKTSQVIEAAAYARGGEATLGLYKATMDSVEASGDKEMGAVYAAYSEEVVF